MCNGMSIAAFFALSFSSSSFAADIPAFPGAEGWGSTTPGGRGGQVLWVTNLNDDGPGSLRDAIETPGPRTILFAVSGVIHLKSTLTLGDREDADRAEQLSFVTIAGQSAPGGGITVADRMLTIGGGVHDVVIRHLRFRNSSSDGISFLRGVRRAILDHCSISWGTDENIGFLGDNQEVTIQNCINAECLHEGGGHPEGPHSKGFLISRGAHHVAVHHNFVSGNIDRNPQFVGNNVPERHRYGIKRPIFDSRNNLVYNCRVQTRLKFGPRVNVIANHFVYGPYDSNYSPVEFTGVDEGSQVYIAGNRSSKHPVADQIELVSAGTTDGKITGSDIPTELLADKPFDVPNITTWPAEELSDRVLAIAGALPRDTVDERLIREFLTGTGACGAPSRTHDSPTPSPAPGTPKPDADRDGMPDSWEQAHGLNPNDPADGNGDRDGDGYTNLEEYLNEVAATLQQAARAWFKGL